MWYKIFIVAWLILSIVVAIGFAMNKDAENKALSHVYQVKKRLSVKGRKPGGLSCE